jgi:small multidrug resistance pump
MAWLMLAIAIVVEVVATVSLRLSEGFTRWTWTSVVVLGYLTAFTLLAQIVRTIPLAVTYAVWSGAGTALTAVVSMRLFGEEMTPVKVMGLALVVTGVVLLQAHGSH